ncbi:MAG: hypothetical protein GWO24_27915 [Akkermansiaceae bacterium]|nr:hypothetical protein [Akkermansiaceae bacterium]
MKLTLAPGEAGDADIVSLRAAGFDDDALNIAVQVVSYFNYINRVADGLGVDSEAWMTPSPAEWKNRKGKDYGAVLGG